MGGGFGLADVENNSPVSERTLFLLGSISKSLTAVAAMELWERGQLDLDVPVQKYSHSFPRNPGPSRHVKSWVIREASATTNPTRRMTPKSVTRSTSTIPLPRALISSGMTLWWHSRAGTSTIPRKATHWLVGCVMQGASGAKYLDFMRQNIVVPAGMERTQADDRFAIIPCRTRFYRKSDSGIVQNDDFLDSSYKIPGGGWLSWAEDMARFEVAILSDKLLKRPTRDLMWTPLKPSDGSKDTYGLGWRVGNEDGNVTVGHSGGQQGTSTDFLIAPSQRAGVVVLTNMQSLNPNELAVEILKILVNGSAKAEKK